MRRKRGVHESKKALELDLAGSFRSSIRTRYPKQGNIKLICLWFEHFLKAIEKKRQGKRTRLGRKEVGEPSNRTLERGERVSKALAAPRLWLFDGFGEDVREDKRR
jgi:hypothetical protein